MPMCDVRPMPAEDILAVMQKVDKFKALASKNVSFDWDDGEWFCTIKGVGWTLDSHGRNMMGPSIEGVSVFWIDYYPHNSLLRFDGSVSIDPNPYSTKTNKDIPTNQKMVDIYNNWLKLYGNAGVTRVPGLDTGRINPNTQPEIQSLIPWWKFWSR